MRCQGDQKVGEWNELQTPSILAGTDGGKRISDFQQRKKIVSRVRSADLWHIYICSFFVCYEGNHILAIDWLASSTPLAAEIDLRPTTLHVSLYFFCVVPISRVSNHASAIIAASLPVSYLSSRHQSISSFGLALRRCCANVSRQSRRILMFGLAAAGVSGEGEEREGEAAAGS
ncbi:hypothetical protein BDZ85DRAFT_95219 [Elsinoe ampelina]|uniref:Uncharacterized protein n=1 Tax=Elsinoe ampelina TaxID=302913 RepID=A0A6A6GE86_9PEZI|nr:hypothetical protein BDZ85DRAFT_95219 [Elsinoe ampelina]